MSNHLHHSDDDNDYYIEPSGRRRRKYETMRWDGKPIKRYCRACKKRQPMSKYTMNQRGSINACDDCQRSGRSKPKRRNRTWDSIRRRVEDSMEEE